MLSKALLFAGFAAAAQAVNFTVKSSGGNATSPYAYGLMFEVKIQNDPTEDILLTCPGHQ